MYWSALSKKEFYILMGIGLLLVFGPLLIHYGERPQRLARAILDGRDEKAREMLIATPKLLNRRDDANGFTPLHWAVIAGRSNLVYWLIFKGAAVNAPDRAGMTPLHKAAVFNRLTCAEMLMAHGAQISPLGRKYGALRLAPIHLAAEEGHAELVKFLIKHGADVNTPTAGANRITPLHLAAAQGRAAVVEALLAAEAEINAGDNAGKTPLAWAIESNQAATARLLRAAGAVP